MIVIDTSALIAIFRQEQERDLLADVIVEADRRLMPAHVYVEFVMVTAREPTARPWLDRLIGGMPILTADVDHVVANFAADAFFRYGKGQGHRATLNFADCMTYAVAKRFQAALLYKGDDFIHTDIESALST